MRRSAFLAATLLMAACHLKGGYGKLDRTPTIHVVRGQDHVVCGKPNTKVRLYYFVYFNWMGEVDVQFKDGTHVKAEGELTVLTDSTVPENAVNVVTTALTVDGKPLELVTTLAPCAVRR